MRLFSKKRKPEPKMTAKEAADYLYVSQSTLRKIEESGALRPYLTPGGHRRYDVAMLNEYLEGSKRK